MDRELPLLSNNSSVFLKKRNINIFHVKVERGKQVERPREIPRFQRRQFSLSEGAEVASP
jgi:hypothetical protein